MPSSPPTSSPTHLRGSATYPTGSGNGNSANSGSNGGWSGSNGSSGNFGPGGDGSGTSSSMGLGDGNSNIGGGVGGSAGQSSNSQHGSSGKEYQEQSISFAAVADTYIRIDRPERNFGTKKELIVGTDGETVTLVKFDIKRFKKRFDCVAKATLSLYSLTTTNGGGVITTYDPNIFAKDELWEETSITWSNSPKERPYKYYKEIGRVRENEWVNVDVTKELDSDRVITFRIVGGRWNKYASKESRHPPVLSIDLC
jgi:hypothetical protein